MGTYTKIQWTERTWNPTTGCTKVSQGCKNCYAERMAKRLHGRAGYPAMPDQFKLTLHPERLELPLHWKKPSMIFVDSMSDLFHEDVPQSFIDQVFSIMRQAAHHTFQILTKRPERMAEAVNVVSVYGTIHYPLRNVWLGVSAEDQKTADERIPWLLKTPAAVRFVSCEPLLNEVDLYDHLHHIDVGGGHDFNPGINWVIAGCESGPKRRPAHRAWFRLLRDACKAAGVPFFLKQMQENGKVDKHPTLDGLEWREFPEHPHP